MCVSVYVCERGSIVHAYGRENSRVSMYMRVMYVQCV